MAQSNMSTVARPYARAAFETALAENALPTWSTMLELLADVVKTEQVSTMLLDPRTDAGDKADRLIGICKDTLDAKGVNFVNVLAEQGRLTALPEIAAQFADAEAAHNRQTRVELVSAYPLSEAQQDKLARALAQRLNREISITTSVDRSLIGGVVIHAGDTVIDGSLRGRLAKLERALNA